MQTHQVIELITGEQQKPPSIKGGKIITLKYPGKCQQCKCRLYPGDVARWFKGGRLYGLNCHNGKDSKDPNVTVMEGEAFLEAFDAAM